MNLPTIALVACTIGMLHAQQRSAVSPRRILTETEENYCTCAMPSYEAEADVHVEKQSSLETSSNRFRIATYFLPADKIRVDREAANWMIELTNGVEMAQFGPNNYRYRAKAPPRWSEGIRADDFPGTHWLIYDTLTAGARNIRLKGEETLTVQGKRVPCYVIELDRDLQYRSGTITGKSTVWIGKQEKFVFKEISSRPPMPPGDPSDPRIDKLTSLRRVVITKLNLTTPPPESMFDLDAIPRSLPGEQASPAGLTSAPLPAPTAPQAETKARRILAEIATYYNSLDTYRARHLAVFDTRSPQGRRLVRMPMDVTYRRPGLWRIAFEQTGDIWIQDRSQPDGFWQVWPKRNLYWRNPYPQFMRGAELLYEDLADDVLSARMLPDETIQAEGKAILCTVIEATYKHGLNILQHETLYTMGGTYKLWIDASRKLVVQWRNGPLLETLLNVELNPVLGDTEFQYKPPPGATVHQP